MRIKQKMKKIAGVLGLITMVSAPALAAVAVYADTSCGGVKTSIISCPDQKGACPTPSDGQSFYDPTEGVNPGSNTTKVAAYQKQYGHAYGLCKDGSTPATGTTQNGVWGLLLVAINILTASVGIAAVGGIVYGSILYTTAGGNADQTKKAIEFIRNVIIGLVAYGLMFAFLNFIIPGGLFAS